MNNINKRESSIELLRIVCEIGIIILHFNNTNIGNALGGVSQGTFLYKFASILQTFFICSVNVFIIISGYFLSKSKQRKISKIILLYFEIIVIQLIFYFINLFYLSSNFEIVHFLSNFLPANYFFILYSVIYIISPYINIVLEQLNKKQFFRLIIIIFVIFSLYSYLIDGLSAIEYMFFNDTKINCMSPIGISGSDAGYTIINFMMLYIIGAYLQIYQIHMKRNVSLMCYLSSSLLIAIINVYCSDIAMFYNSPFVILSSVFIFMYFKQLDIRSNFINKLSKASFTCFLINTYVLKMLNLSVAYTITQYFVSLLLVCILIYLLSFFFYQIYFFLFEKRIKKHLIKIDNINLHKI